MASFTMTPPDLIKTFISAAEKVKMAVMVVYAHLVDGRPSVQLASSSNEAGTIAMWNVLSRVNDRGIEAAARAIHEMDTDNDRPCRCCGSHEGWHQLDTGTQERHRAIVRKVREVLADSSEGKRLVSETTH